MARGEVGVELSSALRERLWVAADWSECIANISAELEYESDPWRRGEGFFELGTVAEHVIPDRGCALGFYKQAWKATGDLVDSLTRAHAICRELGSFDDAATVATLLCQRDPTVKASVAAGRAWLDAGNVERATRLLRAATESSRGSAEIERLLLVADLPESEALSAIAKLLAEVDATTGAEAAALYVDMARIQRRFGSDSEAIETILRDALEQNINDDHAHDLLEHLLGQQMRSSELVELYQHRAAAANTARECVDCYRRGGIALALRFGQRDAAIDLLTKALDTAYAQKVGQVPGHIAMLHLLGKNDLVVMCDRALTCELPDHDRLLIGLMAGHASKEMRYFDIVRTIVPGHPTLAEVDAAARRELLALLQGERARTKKLVAEAHAQAQREAAFEVKQARKQAAEKLARAITEARHQGREKARREADAAMQAAMKLAKVDVEAARREGFEAGRREAGKPADGRPEDRASEATIAAEIERRENELKAWAEREVDKARQLAQERAEEQIELMREAGERAGFQTEDRLRGEFEARLKIEVAKARRETREQIERELDAAMYETTERTEQVPQKLGGRENRDPMERERVEKLEREKRAAEAKAKLENAKHVAGESKRRAQRVAASRVVKVSHAAPTRVRVEGDVATSFYAHTRDLSEAGLFVETNTDVDLGSRLELTVSFASEDGWGRNEYTLVGEVRRIDDGIGFAIEIDDAPPGYVAELERLRANQRVSNC